MDQSHVVACSELVNGIVSSAAFVAYVTTDRSSDKNGKHVRAPSHSAELFFCHVYLSHQGFRATLARCCGRVNSLTDIFVFTKQ